TSVPNGAWASSGVVSTPELRSVGAAFATSTYFDSHNPNTSSDEVIHGSTGMHARRAAGCNISAGLWHGTNDCATRAICFPGAISRCEDLHPDGICQRRA